MEVVGWKFADVYWGAEFEGVDSESFEGFLSQTGVVELDCVGYKVEILGGWLVVDEVWGGDKGDLHELFPVLIILSKVSAASNPSQPCSNCFFQVTIGKAICLRQD